MDVIGNLSNNRRKLNIDNDNRGFTMVELIVTIVIIAIMAALTVGGILAWRDWADFNRENEYAETLFVAAQNQLNDYSADGRLEAMQKSLLGKGSNRKLEAKDKTYNVVYQVGGNWTYNGSGDSGSGKFVNAGYTKDEVDQIWNNFDNKYRDRILSIRAKKGDYATYLNNGFTESDFAGNC